MKRVFLYERVQGWNPDFVFKITPINYKKKGFVIIVNNLFVTMCKTKRKLENLLKKEIVNYYNLSDVVDIKLRKKIL